MSLGICFESGCEEVTDHNHYLCEVHEAELKEKRRKVEQYQKLQKGEGDE